MSATKKHMTSRRNFVQGLGLAVGALTLPSFGAAGANNTVRLGAIGCGARATHLAGWFKKEDKNVEIVACSDPDTKHMDAYIAKHGKMDKYQDYRKLLERDDIDAVIIATPNHWHALHSIHAMQAGKDVYVEKPVTFNLTEGQAMLAARDKYNRIIQAGTQTRSDPAIIDAWEYIRSGEIGKIVKIKGLCIKNRKSIGKIDKPLEIPSNIDYDLWLGGSQELPIMRPQLHYDWHWDFNTGNGDIGNQAPHQFDMITWLLGDPKKQGAVRSFGNRYGWNDGGNTANMQVAWLNINDISITFEVNNMWIKPDLNASPAYKGIRIGVVVTCEGGEFLGSTGGGYIVGEDGKTKIKRFVGDGGGTHPKNFVDAVRSRKAEALNGKLENSIASASLAHLANLSMRSGQETPISKLREELPGDEMAGIIDRYEKQLSNWDVNLEKTPFLLGGEVNADASGKITSGSEEVVELAKPKYRKGYEVTADV